MNPTIEGIRREINKTFESINEKWVKTSSILNKLRLQLVEQGLCKRWGIETGYRQFDHDFKAKTTTKNYHIRLFYFLFSVCVYNLWVLVNICVSLSLYGRLSEKPIITCKLFAVVLLKRYLLNGVKGMRVTA